MRLAPIERPKGFMMRVAYWFSRRQLGKVMTPMKVIYPRVPALMKVAMEMGKLQQKGLSLDSSVQLLVGTLTSRINGCGFCLDIARAMAVREHVGTEKLDALNEWRTSPLFTARERAALAFADESTRNKHVADPVFEELRKHFDEREIVELVCLNAIENFYNIMNTALEIESDGLCAIAEARQTDSAVATAAPAEQ